MERIILMIIALLLVCGAQAKDTKLQNNPSFVSLDQEVQKLKKKVLELNKDLLSIQEELLYPSSTQVAVFISLAGGSALDLNTVQIAIDDKTVANHLYSKRQVDALQAGAVQRVYLGNLKIGEHKLVALFAGKGKKGHQYKRTSQFKFEKDVAPKFIELKIFDKPGSRHPYFSIKEW